MVKVDCEHAQNLFTKHGAKEGSCAQYWCIAIWQNAFVCALLRGGWAELKFKRDIFVDYLHITQIGDVALEVSVGRVVVISGHGLCDSCSARLEY